MLNRFWKKLIDEHYLMVFQLPNSQPNGEKITYCKKKTYKKIHYCLFVAVYRFSIVV